MSMNRRDLIRMGAAGAGGLLISSAARSVDLPLGGTFTANPGALAPARPAVPVRPTAPLGVDQQIFERAKAALDRHGARVRYRDVIGIADFSLASGDPRFHVVDLQNGRVDTVRVAHGSGSDPAHTGFLDHFSNRPGSEATSNGTYATAETYNGKYGLSMSSTGPTTMR
jgi:hypothetical protein